MAGVQNQLPQEQKIKCNAAREWAWQHDEREEEASKHRAEKKDEQNGRFKLFLLREINTVHELLCTRIAVYLHVTWLAVTVHAICEGLIIELLCENSQRLKAVNYSYKKAPL